MKDVLALALSFSLISAPVFAQDDRSEPVEETETAPADAVEPTVTESDAAGSEKSAETPVDSGKKKNRAVVQEKDPIDETDAPPRGTSKWVPGIVVTSVGSALGLLFIAASSTDCKTVVKDKDTNDDAAQQKKTDDDIRDCEKLQPTYRKVGALFLVGGVGVGVPLIYFGLQERSVYKEWRASKEAEQAGIAAPSGHADLVLLPSRNGLSPGLSLTLTF